jgi:hypothetical protein
LTKLIYVGGYGHSGSTLLESLMAESPAVLACGEVNSFVQDRKRKKKRRCSCGRDANKCPVWGFFYAPVSRTIPWTHTGLLDALIQQAGDRYLAIVDSSKTAWKSLSAPFRLKRRFGPEFMLVHLVREPTAVCWSVLKQKNRKASRNGHTLPHYALSCSWTVLGWWLANLSCDLFGLIYPRHYLRLRYEDLVRSTPDEVRMLLERLLPGASWPSSDVIAYDNRHQLHGNKVRLRQLTFADIKEDLKWKSEMPPEYARVVLPLSWLLRSRYGYGR